MENIKRIIPRVMFVLISAIVTLVITGCEKSPATVSDNTQLRINYTIDEGFLNGSAPETRTTAFATENEIVEIALIFYDNTSAKGYIGHSVIYPNTMAVSGTLQMTTPTLALNKTYNVLLLCNFLNYAPLSASSQEQSTNDYLETINTLGLDAAKEAIHFVAHKRITHQLPMYAIGSYIVPIVITQDLNLEVTFQRAVLRVDVHGYDTNFKLETAKIYNYSSTLYPFAIEPKTKTIATAMDSDPAIDSNTGGDIIGGLYCFPNSVDLPRQQDNSTTYLMVKGRYSESASSWYRANILNDNLVYSQNLAINTLYNVNIFDVTSNGVDGELNVSGVSAAHIRTSLVDENVEKSVVDLQGRYISVSSSRVVLTDANPVSVTISVNPLKKWIPAITDTEAGGFFSTNPLDGVAGDKTLVITAKTSIDLNRVKRGKVRITHPDNTALFIDIEVIQ